MDTVECNRSMFDLEAEIAKTAKLVQKLSEAEESINRRRNAISEKQWEIRHEIDQNQDEKLRRHIAHLRLQIISIEQFPYAPGPSAVYYSPGRAVRREKPPYPTTIALAKPIQKLKSEFSHKSKNLAMERKMAKEIQQCEQTIMRETDLTKPTRIDTNSYYWPWNSRSTPTKDVKRLIMIWVEKVEHLSGLILRDCKNLVVPRETIAKLQEIINFGNNFYREINIGRAEFKQQWDSMRDLKKSIERIEFDLCKASRRHERGCAKVERLREESLKIGKRLWEMYIETRIIRSQKSAARRDLLELQEKQNELGTIKWKSN